MAEIDTRQAKDGVRYDVRFRVNGAQRRKTFRTSSDANKYLNKIRADENRGLVIDPQGGEQLFGPYATEWLASRLVKGKPLTPATLQGYKALLRRNINPHFENMRLRQIDPKGVRTWHSKIVKNNGADQAAKSYRLLRAIFNTAVADRAIELNPCAITGAGIENAPERPMLDTSTVLRLAVGIKPRLRALIMLGGFAGLRPGELLGLQRHDIDLTHRELRIQRQAHEITGLGRVITGPKSQAGNRTVALPKSVMDGLSQHLDLYVAAIPEAPIFTRDSGLPLRRSDLSNAWKDACVIAELKGAHPHDLRHHAATVIARNPEVTLKELMATIGHSSPVAALRYQHATKDRNRAIADYLEGVIGEAQNSPVPAVAHVDG